MLIFFFLNYPKKIKSEQAFREKDKCVRIIDFTLDRWSPDEQNKDAKVREYCCVSIDLWGVPTSTYRWK